MSQSCESTFFARISSIHLHDELRLRKLDPGWGEDLSYCFRQLGRRGLHVRCRARPALAYLPLHLLHHEDAGRCAMMARLELCGHLLRSLIVLKLSAYMLPLLRRPNYQKD
jgi:hypothetical protein